MTLLITLALAATTPSAAYNGRMVDDWRVSTNEHGCSVGKDFTGNQGSQSLDLFLDAEDDVMSIGFTKDSLGDLPNGSEQKLTLEVVIGDGGTSWPAAPYLVFNHHNIVSLMARYPGRRLLGQFMKAHAFGLSRDDKFVAVFPLTNASRVMQTLQDCTEAVAAEHRPVTKK